MAGEGGARLNAYGRRCMTVESMTAIHRVLGESLVTIAIIGALLGVFSTDPKSGVARAAWSVVRVFGVLISIQWLLGIINYFSLPMAVRPSLAHPILMTVVVAAFHPAQRRLQKLSGSPRWPLVGLLVATAILLWIGIGLA